RVKTKVPVFDVDRFCGRIIGWLNQTTVSSGRAVNLMIQPPDQIVEHGLLVLGTKAGKNFAALIGNTIAISIFEIPDIPAERRRRHPLSTAPPQRPRAACRQTPY